MPDLGEYARYVLSAYGVSLLLLAGIAVLTLMQDQRVRRALREAEARRGAVQPGQGAGDGG